MNFFNLFRKKKPQLTEEELRWNKMWDLWTDGKADSPFSELMTYQSEINNGGHEQYFSNLENTDDLQNNLTTIKTVLSTKLKNNLNKAYKAYLALTANEDDEKAADTLFACDDVFYENEQDINTILEEYASRIEL